MAYRCNKKYCGKKYDTGHVTEDEIKERFVEVYNSLDRTGVIRNVESIKKVLMSSDKEKAEQKKLQDKYDKCEKKLYKLIEEIAHIHKNKMSTIRNVVNWLTNLLKFKRN